MSAERRCLALMACSSLPLDPAHPRTDWTDRSDAPVMERQNAFHLDTAWARHAPQARTNTIENLVASSALGLRDRANRHGIREYGDGGDGLFLQTHNPFRDRLTCSPPKRHLSRVISCPLGI